MAEPAVTEARARVRTAQPERTGEFPLRRYFHDALYDEAGAPVSGDYLNGSRECCAVVVVGRALAAVLQW